MVGGPNEPENLGRPLWMFPYKDIVPIFSKITIFRKFDFFLFSNVLPLPSARLVNR